VTNRWAVVLILGMAVLSGYALSGPSAQAQTEALPFAVGDSITLFYDIRISCKIAAIRGDFVRCESDDKRLASDDTRLTWWHLRAVSRIETELVR
jgi:hypothetical protein